MGSKLSKIRQKVKIKQRYRDESDLYIHCTGSQIVSNEWCNKKYDDAEPPYQNMPELFSTSLSEYQSEVCRSSVASEKAEHSYEEMVLMFQPLIVQNVIVKQLIPHLHFIDNTDRLIAIADQDPRAAVIYLIDELKNNDKHPGRWKQFIEALESSDYKYIAGILKGEKPMDHKYQREYLKIITPYIRTDICPVDLAEVLWTSEVISLEDREEIQQEHKNHGSLAATDKLLDRVPRKDKYWYSRLIDALKETKLESVAKMLEIPEILNLSVMEDADNRSDFRSDIKPCCHSTPPVGESEPDNLHELPLKKEKSQEQLDTFATCCRKHGTDQNMQHLSYDDIHPKVLTLIQEVRQKEEELAMILQQEPLLKEKLALQSRINEKTMQIREVINKIEKKENEYHTLQGGINDYQSTSNMQANETDYDEHYDNCTVPQASEQSVEVECLEPPHMVSPTVQADGELVADKTRGTYNDSAFFSDVVSVRM